MQDIAYGVILVALDVVAQRLSVVGVRHFHTRNFGVVALGVSTYAIWTRRRAPNFTPGKGSILLSMLTLPGVAISAALGGELVYGKGVGVARMGNAKDKKVQGFDEYKEGRKQA